jgi:hypothetical protein
VKTEEHDHRHDEEMAMNAPTQDPVLQRLARLERAAHWWKLVGGASVVILGLVIWLGASSAKVSDEIQARQFVLLDNEGKARARLGMHPEQGGPYLGLYDKDGKSRAQLIIGSNGSSGLTISSANSPEARASLVVGGAGSALLKLDETDGHILIMAEKGKAGAVFDGKDSGGVGRLHVSIPASAPPLTSGQPPQRIAISLIDQGSFVWIAP